MSYGPGARIASQPVSRDRARGGNRRLQVDDPEQQQQQDQQPRDSEDPEEQRNHSSLLSGPECDGTAIADTRSLLDASLAPTVRERDDGMTSPGGGLSAC